MPEVIGHNSRTVFEALMKVFDAAQRERAHNTGKRSANAAVSGELAPDAGALASFRRLERMTAYFAALSVEYQAFGFITSTPSSIRPRSRFAEAGGSTKQY